MLDVGANKRTGYAVWGEGKDRIECDTFTCWHCNTVVFVPTGQAQREMKGNTVLEFGHCLMCHRPICGPCADLGTCTPFERKLERIEAADRLHRQINGDYR